jgi:integrase
VEVNCRAISYFSTVKFQLGSAELARFRDHYAKTHSPASVNTALDCIQSALTDAFQDNLIDTNEAKRVTLLPDKAAKPQERRPFTDREIRAILKASENDPEWYGMVLCGLYHGFRLGDIASLSWLNIHLVCASSGLILRKPTGL